MALHGDLFCCLQAPIDVASWRRLTQGYGVNGRREMLPGDVNGRQWNVNGRQWTSMDVNGRQWTSMDGQWASMDVNGRQ